MFLFFFDNASNDKTDANESINDGIQSVLNACLDPSTMVQDNNYDDENEEDNSELNENETDYRIAGKKWKIILLNFLK